ncbi:unnamed protein product [Somion occarium]|uniref:ATP synthase subunit e, mitochondrial n=1 Tax=Somion occarium TaxID=3059160 RepID=A0ABP1DW78_9APHY
MAFRNPFKLPIGDLLHRGFIYSLAGVTVWGAIMIGMVHRDTLKRGQEALAVKQAQEREAIESADVLQEKALAEQVQDALQGRKFT